jgi:glycosyltransferase involved in cell wall biosynthesis
VAAPAKPSRREKSVCFVTTDFEGVDRNSGIGTHFWLMSRLLARRDWEVHVLFCGVDAAAGHAEKAPPALAREGIAFHSLADFPAPPGAGIRHYSGDAPIVALGEHALEGLAALHVEHRFSLVEFPDWRALGMRSIQAKASGDKRLDVPLAVKLHSTTQWQREGNLEHRSSPRELKMEFCERYAFERADVQLSPSNYMLDYTRQVEWAVRDDAVVAYPYPDPESEGAAQVPEVRELVFFGRLERRKGLHLFLDALDSVDPEMPVLFLGKDTPAAGGSPAAELIAERLDDRPHRIETELDREGALAELCRGDRLAVIPSLSETFGFTVAECVANRIPFLAARAGGIPEVVDHLVGRERWLFEPRVDALREALSRRLSAAGAEEIELRDEVAAACDPDVWNDRVEKSYRELSERPARRPSARASRPATVTVAVAHYNHDRFLPGALASLATQSRPADEVIVVDDGSTTEAARRVFSEQETLYPQWTFVRQENAGPGATRNRCLERASGTYFLPFDSDNVAAPDLVEKLLEAMEQNPSRAATTCHNLAFVEDTDIDAGEFAFRYSPTGGPRLSACLENVYGDTCALFRTEVLRSVGGFEANRWSPHEDWETFVKMTVRGLEVEVLPQPLFYYRTDSGGRLQELSADPLVPFRQRRHLIDQFLADAELTPRERRDLWECLVAFDRFVTEGVEERLGEQRIWHDSQMADLHGFREAQLEELGDRLGAELEAQRARAEAAEAELAALAAITPRRLLRRAARAARSRVSRSSRTAS